MKVFFRLMFGLGTIINCTAIIVAGILGILFGSHLKESMQDTLMKANGVAVIFIGIGGALSKMLVIHKGTIETTGTMMMIISLALGAVFGEMLDLDGRMTQFGKWLKIKTGNAKDKKFVDGFVTASLTVCIGAMAVVGSIEDGIHADHSILFAKAILDFVIILVMSTSLGKGCLFSFVPVGLFQGSITLLASAISPFITTTAMSALSFVGSILIFCVGLNLVFDTKIRVANLLPGLIIACICTIFPM